jgi:hypothetical protein
MAINVTGAVRLPNDTLFASSQIVIRRLGPVSAQSGAVMLPEEWIVETDGSGEVDFDIEPGTYEAAANTDYPQRIRWSFAVAETPSSQQWSDLINAAEPVLTPALVAEAIEARDDAVAAAASINIRQVADTTALAALDETQFLAAVTPDGRRWDFTTGDFSAQITASDPRYVAPDSDPTGASGAWVQAGSVPTGEYTQNGGARIYRVADRVLGGTASVYSPNFLNAPQEVGMPEITKLLHNWIWRDSEFLWATLYGTSALTGYGLSSTAVNWPGYPTYYPYTMGGQFAFVNDGGTVDHHGAAEYVEATRMSGSGYTDGIEIGMNNYGSEEADPTPFNFNTVASHPGQHLWLQVGAGQDRVYPHHYGYNPIGQFAILKPSYQATGPDVEWRNGTVYPKGASFSGTYAGTKYVVRTGFTSPSSGSFASDLAANPSRYALMQVGAYAVKTYNAGDYATDSTSHCTFRATADTTTVNANFSAERAANPGVWKQLPSAQTGITVAAGALKESGDGTNFFTALKMPTRHQISWQRNDGATTETAAFTICDTIPHGSAAVGWTFSQNLVTFTGSNGVKADQFMVGANKVVGARDTGWGADTGTAKKTANATYSGTASAGYVQAEMTAVMNALRDATQTIKALKDALAAHGLTGA